MLKIEWNKNLVEAPSYAKAITVLKDAMGSLEASFFQGTCARISIVPGYTSSRRDETSRELVPVQVFTIQAEWGGQKDKIFRAVYRYPTGYPADVGNYQVESDEGQIDAILSTIRAQTLRLQGIKVLASTS